MAQKVASKKPAVKKTGSRKSLPPEAFPAAAPPRPRFSFQDEYLSPQELQRVLEERARALARPLAVEETGTAVQVVTFRLGEEHYAVETDYVENIYPLREWTPVPGTPGFCIGVVNLRGRIVSLVDLHAFLGLEKVAIDENTQVIAVNVDGLEVGLLASEVRSVGPLLLEKLSPVLPTTSRVAAEYTRGITPEMIVLLDLPALLRDRRMIVHEEP